MKLLENSSTRVEQQDNTKSHNRTNTKNLQVILAQVDNTKSPKVKLKVSNTKSPKVKTPKVMLKVKTYRTGRLDVHPSPVHTRSH